MTQGHDATPLPEKTRLHWYEIQSCLGQGSSGITYRAIDQNLHRCVAIKEFLPRHLVHRGAQSAVEPHSAEQAADFTWGLRRFLDDASGLAALDHPGVVPVLNAFELNGTAYLVTSWIDGCPLDEMFSQLDDATEARVLRVLAAIFDGLKHIHSAGVTHRDLKAANILVRRDLSPILVGLGTARTVGDSWSQQSLTRTLSLRGADAGGQARSGPWSDVCELSHTLADIILGMAAGDTAVEPPLAESPLLRGWFSTEFLRAIDVGMSESLRERPLGVSEWMKRFPWRHLTAAGERGTPSRAAADNTVPLHPEREATGGDNTDATTAQPDAASAARLNELRVMVLDDDEMICKVMAAALQRLGIGEVEVINAAEAALSRIGRDDAPIDLVISDLHMPDMDGLEFIRHLGEGHHLPALIIFSGAASAVRHSAEIFAAQRGLTVLGALDKPVKIEQLRGLIEPFAAIPRDAQPKRAARQQTQLSREEIENGLANGAVDVYFQPQVSMQTRAVSGFEALARWRHPALGVLGPAAFLPVLEDSDLMPAFTRQVIAVALRHAAAWPAALRDKRLSLNVSAQDLSDLKLPEFVLQQTRENGIAAENITLEITESGVARDAVAALEILTRIRLHNFTLSVDDFGTGYATLDKLKDLPFTELKIDRSFVHGASHNENARTLLESASSLGRKLGLHIVAEGVEDEDDWAVAAACQCDTVQGYLIARPMPARAVSDWMSKHEPAVGTQAGSRP